jgi:hypothetical protein
MKEIDPPITRFECQTGCCLLTTATVILDQLENYFWTDLPDGLAEEVAQRAETVFAIEARQRGQFQGHYAREQITMFMRHWFSAALFKWDSRLYRELPDDFKIGKPLPEISLPRQLERSLPRKSRRKSVPTRRHFAHSSELLLP